MEKEFRTKNILFPTFRHKFNSFLKRNDFYRFLYLFFNIYFCAH